MVEFSSLPFQTQTELNKWVYGELWIMKDGSKISTKDMKTSHIKNALNMKEIKFRAWDKVAKRMCIVDWINFNTQQSFVRWYISSTRQGQYNIPLGDIELLRYTGLKDKNGVEICEGDIMEYYSAYVARGDDPHIKVVVKWNKRYAKFEGCHNGGGVIGNIYENMWGEK